MCEYTQYVLDRIGVRVKNLPAARTCLKQKKALNFFFPACGLGERKLIAGEKLYLKCDIGCMVSICLIVII